MTQEQNSPNLPTKSGFGDIDVARLQSLREKGFNPECIFDIGGSDGSWTRKVQSVFPSTQFHLFEPLADIAGAYTANLESFVSANSNVHLHKVAVGRENGSLLFNHREENPSASTAIEVGNKSRYQQVEVPLVTLDSLIGTKTPVPNMLKIDIQGGELNVLRGCVSNLASIEVLLLETWLSRGYGQSTPMIHELMNFLLPFGFFMFDVGDCWRNANGSLISQDFYFVNERSEMASDYSFYAPTAKISAA